MTRKEFITNLVRDLGFEVLQYVPHKDNSREVDLRVQKEDLSGVLTTQITRSSKTKIVSVKIIFQVELEKVISSLESTRNIVRTIQAWLAERGFEAVVDWIYGPGLFRILRIRSIGYPWNQCAKAMTEEEALADALSDHTRFQDSGNVFFD